MSGEVGSRAHPPTGPGHTCAAFRQVLECWSLIEALSKGGAGVG